MMSRYTALILLIAIFAYGCGGPDVTNRDGPPAELPDMQHVPDATPRIESPSRYGNPESYEVFGKRYRVMPTSLGYTAQGVASWYGTKFHGKRTSSGEPYDMYSMTAAHRSLPLPTYVEVRNLENGRRAIVRVNDRGPFHGNRIIDLSYAAASKLGILNQGTAKVEVRAIDPRQSQQSSATTVIPAGNATAVAAERRIYLQAGAFSSRDNAQRFSSRLQQTLSTPVRVLPSSNPDAVYRVQIGPLASTNEITALTEQLQGLGVGATHVVHD